MITFALIDAILKILLVGLMGFICGLLSYFLDYCFWKGSVFDFYLPWLGKNLLKIFFPEKHSEIMLLTEKARNDEFVREADIVFFYKMLGGCSVCFNIWISLLSWVFICYGTFFEWYFIFPYVLMSSWNIRRLVKATY